MPGVLKPSGAAASTWEWLSQILTSITKRLTALEHNQTALIQDQWQNTVIVTGLLDQTVTNGANWAYGGVVGPTGLTGAGLAICQNYVTPATVTAGSDSITVTNATGYADGLSIAGPGIPAGTTITNVSGTSITISTNATENGSGVLVTAFIWRNIADYTYP